MSVTTNPVTTNPVIKGFPLFTLSLSGAAHLRAFATQVLGLGNVPGISRRKIPCTANGLLWGGRFHVHKNPTSEFDCHSNAARAGTQGLRTFAVVNPQAFMHAGCMQVLKRSRS